MTAALLVGGILALILLLNIANIVQQPRGTSQHVHLTVAAPTFATGVIHVPAGKVLNSIVITSVNDVTAAANSYLGVAVATQASLITTSGSTADIGAGHVVIWAHPSDFSLAGSGTSIAAGTRASLGGLNAAYTGGPGGGVVYYGINATGITTNATFKVTPMFNVIVA